MIKKCIKKWLGINRLEDVIESARTLIGMDIGFKEQSWIIVVSHLGGGQIRIIPTHFKDYLEFAQESRQLKNRYGKQVYICDAPLGFVD